MSTIYNAFNSKRIHHSRRYSLLQRRLALQQRNVGMLPLIIKLVYCLR